MPLQEEINSLRRTLRLTRRDIRRGYINPVKGARILTQTSTALATFLRLQQRLDTKNSQQAFITRLTSTVVSAVRHHAANSAESQPDPTSTHDK